MTRINELSRLDTVADGDLVPLWATSKGDDRAAAMSTLLTYLQNNLDFPTEKQTQHESPNTEGFTVRVRSDTSWLILNPAAIYAAGTVILPAEPKDKDQVVISTRLTIGVLTIRSDVVTVPRPPEVLTSNHAVTMKYDGVDKNWYVTAAP